MDSIVTVLLCTSIVFILCYIYSRQNLKYWKRRNVAYAEPVPLFGNAYPVLSQNQSLGKFLSHMHNSTKHSYMGFYLLESPNLLIRDYNVLRNILLKDFEYFTDRSVLHNTNDEYARHLLFMLPGKEWKGLRKEVTPVFSLEKLKGKVSLIGEIANNLVEYIDKVIVNDRIDCVEVSTRYGIDSIASCFFGLSGDCLKQENSELYSMCTKFFDHTSTLRAVQMVSHFTIPSVAKLMHMKFLHPKASEFVDKIVTDAIDKRIKEQSVREDVIDVLVNIQQREQGDAFDHKKLPVVAIQFVIGGYQASAGAVTFLLYELSKNQFIQTRLREEIISVHEKYQEFSSESIKDMQYLDMVVKETLRKYPLLPFMDRRCVKSYKVPDENLIIEKGVGVFVSIYGLHHDPNNFPDPENFDPERFSIENKASIPPGAFMPFGYGMRNCMGTTFTYLSVKMAVIKIITTYQIDKSSETPDTLQLADNWLFIAPKSPNLFLNFKKLISRPT
ncbi:hypothetical protein RN001_012882 [Aquatica leii]|uniref:Cytochrome P450 n=1 Tax=Aquatica leii TaxID=1421715 RepID=A0AAN7NZ01_9COLE|nr:hypothetical protein RN001_012882 [Aquatica leii]